MTPHQLLKAAQDRERDSQLQPTVNGVKHLKPKEHTQAEIDVAVVQIDALIGMLGLRNTKSDDELSNIVKAALEASSKAIEQYKQGNEKALNAIVGQVMKVTKAYDGAKIIAEIKRNLGFIPRKES